MKCYSRQEWLLYSKSSIDNNTAEKMEQHLESCEACLEAYISVIEESHLEDARPLVPAGLTRAIMEKVSKEKTKGTGISGTKKFMEKFIYYAVAASLTLILTSSGFFRFVSDNLPKAPDSLASSSVTFGNAVARMWSEDIIHKTQILLNQINRMNFKER